MSTLYLYNNPRDADPSTSIELNEEELVLLFKQSKNTLPALPVFGVFKEIRLRESEKYAHLREVQDSYLILEPAFKLRRPLDFGVLLHPVFEPCDGFCKCRIIKPNTFYHGSQREIAGIIREKLPDLSPHADLIEKLEIPYFQPRGFIKPIS